jgi:hypothetical protein
VTIFILKFLQSIEASFGTHPAYYSTGFKEISPRVKQPGLEAYNSLSSNAKVKNCGAIPPLLNMSS